jgi:hypothetical protein
LPLFGAKLGVDRFGVDDVLDGAPDEAGAAGDEDDCTSVDHHEISRPDSLFRDPWYRRKG